MGKSAAYPLACDSKSCARYFKIIPICLVLMASLPTGSLMAQVMGPNPIIAGTPVVCGGIPTVVRADVGDIARATPGWINLHPQFFSLPGKLQLFIYAHECGHHVVGLDETLADCWAIRTGRDQGWFQPADIQWLIAYFSNNPGDWSHEPGWMRLQKMIHCYSTP